MLTFLPHPIVALIGILLQVLNVIICGIYVTILAPFKLLFWPFAPLFRIVQRLIRLTPTLWSTTNSIIIWLCTKIEWDVVLPKDINKKNSYLLICNHQSWNDISINQKFFYPILPPVVYFLKRELIWVPLLGWACWLLDFPFMKRYSKRYLQKHPEKRGQDIESTRKTCEKYRDYPVTMVNYPEGTRFTKAKHDQQHSPFKYLLKPRAGGIALALQGMQGQIKHIVNVTIVYPDGAKGFWAFLGGAVKKVKIRTELIPVTANLIGDYLNDETFRMQFQQWLNQLWQAKDKLIAELI